jgi:hypothetical protein
MLIDVQQSCITIEVDLAMTSELTAGLIRDLTRLYDNTMAADVTISVGRGPTSRNYRAHSMILQYRSPYFERLFEAAKIDGVCNDDRNASGHAPILLQDMQPTVFETVLR